MGAKVAIVAGAGGALGHALMVTLAAGGLTVVAVDRNERALGDFPGSVRAEVADTTDPAVATRLIVLANEIKHPEARGGPCPALHRQQGLVHQAFDLVEYPAADDSAPGTHRRGRFQVEAPRRRPTTGQKADAPDP